MSVAVFAVESQLSGKRFRGADFSGRDLSHCDLSRSEFLGCNFDRADLTRADCEGADFTGSTFRDSILYRTNFKDAVLAGTAFEPKDCFGVTITMECRTFRDMRVGGLWYYCWLILLSLTFPEGFPGAEEIRDRLIGLIGAERYVRLKAMFQRREM